MTRVYTTISHIYFQFKVILVVLFKYWLKMSYSNAMPGLAGKNGGETVKPHEKVLKIAVYGGIFAQNRQNPSDFCPFFTFYSIYPPVNRTF